jgi:alpha-D-ribose 1-methylphosphonate 5-triphosphate synthase subunit PhnH
MGFDLTRDCQKAFRALLDAHSYPGRVFDLAPEARHVSLDSPLPKPLIVIVLCLLDIETSFCVVSVDRGRDEAFIAELCGARPAAANVADFIFVVGADLPLAATIAEARAGDLVDPHEGATIVAEVTSLVTGRGLRLSGPGIDGEARLEIGRDCQWIDERARKNREFPLGVDLLFYDPGSRITALPRTTRVMEGE